MERIWNQKRAMAQLNDGLAIADARQVGESYAMCETALLVLKYVREHNPHLARPFGRA